MNESLLGRSVVALLLLCARPLMAADAATSAVAPVEAAPAAAAPVRGTRAWLKGQGLLRVLQGAENRALRSVLSEGVDPGLDEALRELRAPALLEIAPRVGRGAPAATTDVATTMGHTAAGARPLPRIEIAPAVVTGPSAASAPTPAEQAAAARLGGALSERLLDLQACYERYLQMVGEREVRAVYRVSFTAAGSVDDVVTLDSDADEHSFDLCIGAALRNARAAAVDVGVDVDVPFHFRPRLVEPETVP